MARPKNKVPSVRIRLDLNLPMPVTDPDVQRAVDWLSEKRAGRRAAPMAFQLIVMALAGKMGAQVQEAVEMGDVELARQAAEQMKSFFVVDDDE